MKLDLIASSKNDEFYTPKYAILPIIKYLKEKKYKTIWCPFDTKESWFVKVLKQEQFNVINTHKITGEDFFSCIVPKCDCIVSNPPYSLKGEVLQRLFDLKIPFAMLVGIVGLFESQQRFTMFQNNIFEVLYLNKRVAFFKDFKEQQPSLNPPFSSVYICSHVLPKQICFAEINKKELK